jgi:hypothetical protein
VTEEGPKVKTDLPPIPGSGTIVPQPPPPTGPPAPQRLDRWREVFAIVGIAAGFLFFFTIPGWFGISAWRRYRRGEPSSIRGWSIWGMIFVALFVLGLIGGALAGTEETQTPPPYVFSSPAVSEDAEHDANMAAAQLAWDHSLTASERAQMCDFYNTPPVGTTPELVEPYAEAAGLDYAEADAVLGELLAREC